MNKIIKKRGEGKTAELIKMSFQTGYPLVVCNNEESSFVLQMARLLKYEIPPPLILSNIDSLRGRETTTRCLVDEADHVLQWLLDRHCAKFGQRITIDSIALTPNKEDDEHAKLQKAAQPLVNYIRENYDPHTTILVENDFVRVVRDDLGVPFDIHE